MVGELCDETKRVRLLDAAVRIVIHAANSGRVPIRPAAEVNEILVPEGLGLKVGPRRLLLLGQEPLRLVEMRGVNEVGRRVRQGQAGHQIGSLGGELHAERAAAGDAHHHHALHVEGAQQPFGYVHRG